VPEGSRFDGRSLLDATQWEAGRQDIGQALSDRGVILAADLLSLKSVAYQSCSMTPPYPRPTQGTGGFSFGNTGSLNVQ